MQSQEVTSLLDDEEPAPNDLSSTRYFLNLTSFIILGTSNSTIAKKKVWVNFVEDSLCYMGKKVETLYT